MVPAAAQGDESAGTNEWIKNHPSRLLAAQAFAFWRSGLARLARQDPPFAPHTRAIAEAKIATLQGQIAAMKRGNGHQPALSE